MPVYSHSTLLPVGNTCMGNKLATSATLAKYKLIAAQAS